MSISRIIQTARNVSSLPRHSSALLPRLEDHYYNNIMEDLMVLMYDHDSVNADLDLLSKSKEWNRKLPENHLDYIYSMNLDKLPTNPFSDQPTTSLLSKESSLKGQERIRKPKRMFNPIDYTIIKKEEWVDVVDKTIPPFEPVFTRIPIPKKISLKIWTEDAIKSKSAVLSSIMILESISGAHATPLVADIGDATRQIREGMAMGGSLELEGSRMWNFLDKLTQCVFPRIREWEGLEALGDDNGSISFKIPSFAIGYMPDIEHHFDSFPKLYDVDIVIHTTGKSDWETALCLSSLQIPIQPQRIEKNPEEAEVLDKWAQLKNAKTKEERIQLAQQLQEDKRKKL